MRLLWKSIRIWAIVAVIALELDGSVEAPGSTGPTTSASDNGKQSSETPTLTVKTDSRKESGEQIPTNPSSSSIVQSSSLANEKSRHTVTLRWNASVPATKSPVDAIKQYRVCRSMQPKVACKGKPENTIDWVPASNTIYVDTHGQSGQIYYYVTTAVSMGGAESQSSNEVHVQIP